jgi:S-adenosylmethionine decarboxylase
MEIKPIKKLKLFGFNNLTKTLSFNMYDINYAKNVKQREDYIAYIDEEYNADRLTDILSNVSRIIGANILNIAKQDYDPQGASVTMLICEEKIDEKMRREDISELYSDTLVAHLDKSHITVHTYPESHPDGGISSFRADIDVSTCGRISPLRALNYLLGCFNADIAMIDYRVRGFTRNVAGKKFFIDHKINSIQNYIDKVTSDRYHMIDVNVYQENIFHTKMLLKNFNLNNYFFGMNKKAIPKTERKKIKIRLKKEMAEIFYGQNIPLVKGKKKKDNFDDLLLAHEQGE